MKSDSGRVRLALFLIAAPIAYAATKASIDRDVKNILDKAFGEPPPPPPKK